MTAIRIAGIPARVEYDYTPPYPGAWGPSWAEPPEAEAVEITAVYDRRGRPAPWLARKLGNATVYEDATAQIIAAHKAREVWDG